MSDIFKVQAVWSGFLGGPGVNTFYSDTEPTDLDPWHDFYAAIATGIPGGVSVSFPGDGVKVDSVTGALTGGWSVTPPANVNGSGEGQHAAGTGAVVRWTTGEIIRGRRLYGHSYLVPLTRGNYNVDGRLLPAAVSAFQGAAMGLVGALGTALQVWSRPVAGAGGVAMPVTGAVVPLKVAELRSRRD
jgi:hypothetical protein